MSRKLRRTKIVCTMGPATDRGNTLEKIIAAGANMVRMNSLTVFLKITSNVRIKCVKLLQD
ncbi:Pyruvate kinase II [Mannheimia haemolytica]|nr:Pyruvate kinase II [Mannheimia haemolytica]